MSDAPEDAARSEGVSEEERAVAAADELLAEEGVRDTAGEEVAPGEADRFAPGAVTQGLEHLG